MQALLFSLVFFCLCEEAKSKRNHGWQTANKDLVRSVFALSKWDGSDLLADILQGILFLERLIFPR